MTVFPNTIPVVYNFKVLPQKPPSCGFTRMPHPWIHGRHTGETAGLLQSTRFRANVRSAVRVPTGEADVTFARICCGFCETLPTISYLGVFSRLRRAAGLPITSTFSVGHFESFPHAKTPRPKGETRQFSPIFASPGLCVQNPAVRCGAGIHVKNTGLICLAHAKAPRPKGETRRFSPIFASPGLCV